MNNQLTLSIPYLESIDFFVSMEEVSGKLDQFVRHPIAYLPWADGNQVPDVQFSIAYNAECILLKYYVVEQEIRATCVKFNDPVYEDSCVEFFIAFNEETMYYNLEFNCLGTPRVGYGPDRNNRDFIDTELLKDIRSLLKLTKEGPAQTRWELLLQIPLTVFSFHPAIKLKNTPSRLNFYKCGDALPNPHFLCYSNVVAKEPNFHLPQFFSAAVFN